MKFHAEFSSLFIKPLLDHNVIGVLVLSVLLPSLGSVYFSLTQVVANIQFEFTICAEDAEDNGLILNNM